MQSEETDFIPREYQIELYEEAVKNNIILYLPTGAGKTYIAVMLLKRLSSDIYKPYKEGGKRSVFAVNTVALVLQQAEYISRHTGLKCAGYSGDMQVDLWKETDWLAEIEKHQVLVMTSQILFDILTRNYLKLNQINLIVFDECHRAVNLHPMRQIMQQFEMYPKEEQPRVLAMSATLLNSNIKPSKIESTIKSLEVTFQAKIMTVKSMNYVEGYCTNPQEQIVEYEPLIVPDIATKVNRIIDASYEMLDNIRISNDDLYNESSPVFQPKKKSTKLKAIMKDIQTNMLELGIYGSSKACLLHLIQLEYLKKYCDEAHTVLILENLITQIVLIRKLLDNEMRNYKELDRINRFTSHKLRQLFAILKNFNKNKTGDQKFCCIIFVKERFMTQVIYHILKSLCQNDKEFNFLLPEFVVGFQNNPYKNTRESQCIAKWNKEVLKKFKNGLSNCIVATDVVDEGIDVPTCTLIIRFDMPMDFRAYVQSKGRARHGSSYYKLLVSTIDEQFSARYKLYQQTELELKRILVGYDKLRMLPSIDDIKKDLYKHEIKPYIVMRNGTIQSVLAESAAIQLINMYCSSLLKSKFVHLSPIWTLYEAKEDTAYQVSLKLPNISPLKDTIVGNIMTNIDSAKRSAAMKSCIKLHKMNALTDKLVPSDSNIVLEKLNYLFPNWIDEDVSDRSCGTYKKVRQHKLQYPMALSNAFPRPSVKLYLHVLHLMPVYPIPLDDKNLTFHGLLNDKSGFGILSTKSMPKIPSFPIFMNVGELRVTVKSNYETMILDENNIKSLKLYHHLLFSEVVPVMKKFMVFDRDNLENSFLIVPLNDKWEINWDTVKNNGPILRITPTPFAIVNSDYELALVKPSYRGSQSVYVVTKVCDDMTPQSYFPTSDYDSYQDYYQKRYGLIIKNQNQPILHVKSISIKINCLKPRGINSTLSKRRKADLLEEHDEYLIPEFCERINFPALYWLKASTLPSILHRVSQLLIAEDLRVTISKEVGLGVLTLPPDVEWPALEITQEMELQADKSLLDISMDETPLEIMQSEPNLNEIELNSLKTEINVYPWSKEQEPQDLYRNIEEIQLIDIEYYNNFMCKENSFANNIASRANKVGYMTKPIVPAPPLNMLQEKLFGPDPVEILHALTTKMSNDVFNLERLETLGDSFLKFITSLFLYHEFPTFTEGHLTSLKGKIIGNRNLYYSGTKKCLPGRLKIDEFVAMSTFIVPAYTVFRPLQKKLLDTNIRSTILYEFSIPETEKIDGYISTDTNDKIDEIILEMHPNEKQSDLDFFFGIQMVSDKTVADSIEALIGAYLRNTGVIGATKLLKWLDILPSIQIHKLLNNDSPNPNIGEGDPNLYMPWADSMEERIDYKFKNRAFLLQAFTHPSYIANGITECYQRLEFLGDAILDFLITCYIYEICGNLSPGDLTDLRSALVNNITFACLTVRYGLHTGLLAYAPKLNEAIDHFVIFQEKRNYVIDDELLQILLEEDECSIAEYVDVPKALGDIFESLIGAIYLDSGKNLTKVWNIVYALMHKEIDKFSKNVPKQPIRVIYETYDTRPTFMEATMIKDTNTIMVPLKIKIGLEEKFFYGFGGNKKQAKCAAAKQALKILRNNQ